MIIRRARLKPGRKPIARSRLKSKPKRNPMPPGRRDEIFERDGYRCRSCGRPVLPWTGHVHHIKFKSHGVDHSPANLILLCGIAASIVAGSPGSCHERVHLRGNPRWWLWIVGDATTAEFSVENPRK